jgi:hypothetical protein
MASKRTPGEIWKQIVVDARDDEEIEQLAAMTGPELDRELADAGFDVAEVRADANAIREKLERSVAERKAKEVEAQARVRSTRPQASRPQSRRVPGMVWFVAATVGAAAAGGLVYALTHPGSTQVPAPPAPPSSAPAPEPSPADLIAASELRRRAFGQCAAKRWTECLAGLDRAKTLDPATDRSPGVQMARQQIEHQLAVDGGSEGDKPKLK